MSEKTIKVQDAQGKEHEAEIPTRKVRMLMVNPSDFLYLFTKGLKVRKRFQIISGVPDDAMLLAISADPIRHAIVLVVQSESYEPIPTTDMPPIEMVEIELGLKDATKKKSKKK